MKRVVLEHTQGARKGLRQIVGAGDGPPPETLPAFEWNGDIIAGASLIRVTPRIVYFREFYGPEKLGRFNEAQV